MTPVFQTITDKDHGNCMQAVMASLFDLKLDDVPHFLEFGDRWFSVMMDFLKSMGYERDNFIYNKGYLYIINPTRECFEKPRWHKPSIMTPKKLYKEPGINGYFYAGVFSPNNFKLEDRIFHTHAVVIDRDYNIVHDPNPQYRDIFGYPLGNLMGYNGIINVNIINPIV